MIPSQIRRSSFGGTKLAAFLFLLIFGVGCSGPPPVEESPAVGPDPTSIEMDLAETPVADGPWRPHRLSSCREDVGVPTAVEKYLGICSEYYRDGSGSDGMIEMEMGLEAGHRHSLMLLTLGQLYLMAGQGDPDLLPVEGPAGDVGDWDRNRVRLLGRAEDLLLEAAPARPDDAAVDYLLADVARARGDQAAAAELVASGLTKCTGGRSFAILWQYQHLNKYPSRYLGGPSPDYPQSALEKGVTGDVVLDLLLGPDGRVRQVAEVASPAKALTEAAAASLRKGSFEASRIGKYPIWSWLRVTTAFKLDQ